MFKSYLCLTKFYFGKVRTSNSRFPVSTGNTLLLNRTLYFCFDPVRAARSVVNYLIRDMKLPNHQSCFIQFFHKFFSVLAVEKENNPFICPKQVFSQSLTNEKFVFFFNCSNWEKFMEKIRRTKCWKYLMNPLIITSLEII